MQRGVTVVEIAMFIVVLAIIAVVAIPQFAMGPPRSVNGANSVNSASSAHNTSKAFEQNNESSAKVKSAFALAIAHKGGFPTLTELVEFIDADFASETHDLSGVMFRDQHQRLTINTYVDSQCNTLTNSEQSGVSDVVRCVQSLN